MARYARTTAGSDLVIHSVGQPFSFFDFADQSLAPVAFRRLLSQARMHNCKTMTVEKVGRADDLTQENEDIKTRYGSGLTTSVSRISFFSKSFKNRRGLRSATNDDFLGYIILKENNVPGIGSVKKIYESVIRQSRHDNNFTRGHQQWASRIDDCTFKVSGHLYAQQNNITNVCAHVALRTAAARYHPDGDMLYREMNNIVGIDHIKKKTGGPDGDGLTSAEMVQILEAAGARCFVGDYTKTVGPPVPYQKYLYGSIESGFPAIVFFGLASSPGYHTVPVLGHTFNQDTWVPNADISYFKIGPGTKYIPSESWLSMFIAHDDNWGSNYCIPRRYLHAKRTCTQLKPASRLCPEELGGVAFAISTVPKSVKLSPIRAEAIGADYLFTILPQLPLSSAVWATRLDRYANSHVLVLRPILVSGQEYVRHLDNIRDWEGHRISKAMVQAVRQYLNNLTDESFWLVELSIPELFSTNHRKVGEVLIRAEIPAGKNRDFANFVLCRLPGHFAMYKGGSANNPKYNFIPTGITSHVPLFGSL